MRHGTSWKTEMARWPWECSLFLAKQSKLWATHNLFTQKEFVFKSIISICSYTHITGILWVWLIQKLDWEKNNTFHIVSYDLAWPANSSEQSRLKKQNSIF
jgi:hypothetical protein